MSQIFIDSKGSVSRPGVFAIEVAPPRTIRGVSSGYIGYVGKFAWGPIVPDTGVGFLPASGADAVNTFEPAGSPRSSSGYYGMMKRKRAPWFIAGIKGSGAAAATKSDAGTGGNMVSTAKYKGALGNSIQRTQQAAASGDATKRDLIYTLTDPVTGTITETYRDVAMNVAPDVSKSLLLASIVFSGGTMTAWPSNGTANLASGSDGAALTAADYQAGLDALALESKVSVVVVDNCGDSIRAAVNADIVAHLNANTDRVAFLQSNPGDDWSTVKSAAALLRTKRLQVIGNWAQVYDDAGVLQTSPATTCAATARVNIERFASHAWRDPSVLDYYSMIQAVSTAFAAGSDAIQDEATTQGISLVIPLDKGGFGLLNDRTSSLTEGERYMVTRWYKNYLAKSLVPAVDSYVNGPNAPAGNREIAGLCTDFLEREKLDGALVEGKDAQGNLRPAYSVDIVSDNPQSEIDLGNFTVAIDGKNPSVRERIFFKLNVGENVTVRDAA